MWHLLLIMALDLIAQSYHLSAIRKNDKRYTHFLHLQTNLPIHHVDITFTTPHFTTVCIHHYVQFFLTLFHLRKYILIIIFSSINTKKTGKRAPVFLYMKCIGFI